MIDLKFPRTTIVGKPVPKNAFYKHLEVNAKMKQHFAASLKKNGNGNLWCGTAGVQPDH